MGCEASALLKCRTSSLPPLSPLLTVIAITAALELRRAGFKVKVVARDLPSDIESTDFASPWAGANWSPFGSSGETESARRDKVTFARWLEIVRSGKVPESLLALLPFEDVVVGRDPWWRDTVVDVSPSGLSATLHQLTHPLRQFEYKGEGATYKSFCLDAPRWHQHLTSEFLSSSGVGPPGTLERLTITSLQELSSLTNAGTILLNASGLGSSDLTDVSDPLVHPIRGQTLLIRATPAFASNPRCVMHEEAHQMSYIIPRARSGFVICGGSLDVGATDLEPDVKLSERILRCTARLCPELVPAAKEGEEKEDWLRIEVVKTNVALRPAREGDARVERDQLVRADGQVQQVVHAYGAGEWVCFSS